MQPARPAALPAVGIGSLAAVWLLRDAPGRALRGLEAPRSWFATVGTDRAVATLAEAALWLAAGWLALGLTCTLIARTPGAIGTAAATAGRALLPGLLVRLLAGSAGLGVLVAPIPASAHPPPRPVPAAAVSPAPVWPSDPGTAHLPGPRWPVVQPAAQPADRPTPAKPPPSPDDAVRVRPGDSLWLLAAHRLGPHARAAQIAAEWPRWYAANRTVIGPDPDHIVAGQLLRVPAEGGRGAG